MHRACFESVSLIKDRKLKRSIKAAEFFEDTAEVRKKAKQVAQMMKASALTVVFTGAHLCLIAYQLVLRHKPTGAGLSVSAGIPDCTWRVYMRALLMVCVVVDRGSAGVDTLEGLGVARTETDDEPEIDYTKLAPTVGHKVISSLVASGLVQYVATQNCGKCLPIKAASVTVVMYELDDLHYKSGVPEDKLSELHGNVFVEYCERCKRVYRRDYCVDAFSTDCTEEPWFVKCPKCRCIRKSKLLH
jgi:mono-ADP-ribosyltransferase sirtuin 6